MIHKPTFKYMFMSHYATEVCKCPEEGVLYHKEIDFVAVRRNEKVYIQVADNISEDETFNREVSPLLSIKDAYPRILLARTGHAEYQYEGIHIIDLGKWLTEYSPKME